MEIVHGELVTNAPVAIFPGAFHPPTIAHLGLARAALSRAGAVLFTLPRAFPHKEYGPVSLDHRIALLARLAENEPGFAVALSGGGLFVDMARELARLRPSIGGIYLVCGRDAAERILNWPYPESDPIERQLEEFSLLVAARDGELCPPPHLAACIETLPQQESWDGVSSSRVRAAIASGAPWRSLVPPEIQEQVAALYSPSRLDSKNVRSR